MGADRNQSFLALLVLLAVYIWAREFPKLSSLENTLPILAALPLFLFMASPWRLRRIPLALSPRGMAGGAAGFVTGLALDSAALLAASWACLLWTWISASVEEDLPVIRRLMVLPFLAFPWLDTEGSAIGWHFRLSGAWAAAQIFSVMGFGVVHHGTLLAVQGLPVGIGEACSGMNVLQSMLIAGSALTWLYLGRHRAYWVNILGLIAAAWLANALRIIILCIAALTLGREFAFGVFHTWGGWLVLALMLCLSWGVLSLQAALFKSPSPPGAPS
jgi:exosortase/archaeosortase family protein